MSFLGVAFLFALPLAALPVVLHFIDRRRNVEIEWGAMQFLNIAASEQTHSRRLKEWLLLLCRIAAIAALVFALARPLAPVAWLGGVPRGETFLVIDNSLSTSQKLGDSTKFQTMLNQTRELMASLPQQESIRLLVTSPVPTWIELRDGASEQLATLTPTLDDSDLIGSLMIAAQAPSDPSIQRRDIVLVTDGMASNWDTENEQAWTRLHEAIATSKVATNVRILGTESNSGGNNLAITDVVCRQSVVGLDETISIRAKLKNFSTSGSVPIQANWYVDGKLNEQVPVAAIEPGATQDILWNFSFDRRGVHAIKCRAVVEDSLAGDNDSTVIIEVVDRIPILLVDDGDGFTESDQDAYFTQAALGYGSGEESGIWRSVYEPRVIALSQLDTIDLDTFRAVVIPNLQDIPGDKVDRLSEFVASGGGLWLALGPRTDIRQFNQRLYKDGDGLSPVRLDTLIDTIDGTAPLLINPYLGSHPATTQLVDSQKMDTGDVIVTQRIPFDSQTLTPDVSVLLGLTNGEPLVVEQTVQRGRVIVQAIPLRRQWSELIKSQAFVVMVQDWLGYLTQPRATQHNLSPGQPISWRLTPAQHTTATLVDPTGSVVDLTGQPEHESVVFHTTRTHLPGMYQLEPGLSGVTIPFYVGRRASESDLSPLSSKQVEFIRNAVKVDRPLVGDDVAASGGRPLWPLLLIALAVFMVADCLLSGMISRQRFGVEAIAARETNILSTTVPSYSMQVPVGTAKVSKTKAVGV